MAKINTALIEGYDTMSAEEKLAALEALEIADSDTSKYDKLKLQFDAKASELAKAKKELQSHLSTEEVEKQNQIAATEELTKKYEALLRSSELSKQKAQLLAMGYEEKLADATATAMLDGDYTKVFTNMAVHKDAMEKRIKADILKETPPPVGNTDNVTTMDDLRKMSSTERYEFSIKNPETYRKIYGGNT